MKRRYLVLLALLSFVITLVLHAPANLLYAWTLGARPGAVALHGVQGTLSQGRFDALSVNNRPVLADARWALHPAWLALLRFSADIETGGATVARVRISKGLLGTLRLSHISAAGSVKALAGVLGQPALPVEGQARIEAPLLRLDGGLPVEAEGEVQVENLVWTLSRDPLPLGSFSARLGTDDKGVAVSLAGGPGPLELDGTATLAPDRAYDLQLKLRPRPEATAQLLTLVRSLGQPDAQGWYHVRRSGQFK